jgi:PEGA domain
VHPRKRTIGLVAVCLAIAAMWPTRAVAQWRYPYPPPGYYAPRDLSALRLEVTPKEAQVYVDGYYAGIVDDYDGTFQRMHLPPGAHEIVLYLDGYRTVHQKVYLTPDDTYKLRYKMEKNLAGETSEPPPAAPTPTTVPPPGPGAPPAPAQPGTRRGGYPPYPPQSNPPSPPAPPQRYPEQQPPSAMSAVGTLVLRVQPAGAEILVDGEAWQGPEGDERLVLQLSEGSHRVEIHRDGYRVYSRDIQVRRGETVPLNVALSPERN